MIGFKAYQTHIAIMMHFNEKSDYDYFKYNGKTKSSLESFKKNKKNIYKYGGIEKRVGKDIETFFFTNMKDGYKAFVPQLWYKYFKNEISIFNAWAEEDFVDEMKMIIDTAKHEGCKYKDLFKGGDFHLHPMLYVWYDRGIISEYTLLFIDIFIRKVFDEQNSSDPLLWKEVVDKHQHRVGFYRRCYFYRLQSKEEMIKIGQTQLEKI